MKTSGELPIVLEEYVEYISNEWKQKPEDVPGSALKVKIRNTHECVLMAYPLQYLALKWFLKEDFLIAKSLRIYLSFGINFMTKSFLNIIKRNDRSLN